MLAPVTALSPWLRVPKRRSDAGSALWAGSWRRRGNARSASWRDNVCSTSGGLVAAVDGPGELQNGDVGEREWLVQQLTALETVARASERKYAVWRRRFEWMHYLLGVPATTLAAVASASAFAKGSATWIAGLLAGLAAALAAVQTFVRPDQRAKFNQQQQFAMARLADDVMAFRSVELAHVADVDEAFARRRALQERYFAAREASPA
jgi:hypothetical protein